MWRFANQPSSIDVLSKQGGQGNGPKQVRNDRLRFLSFRCQCGKCSTELLVSAREYRCCREVHSAYGKVTFEGMQDTAPCVIDHPDYKAMVNKAVLLQVGPLLKGRNGKSYRRRPGVSQEEYVFFNDFFRCLLNGL